MQREISVNLQVVLAIADGLAVNVGAAKDNIGILIGQQNNLLQLFVNYFLLRLREYAAGLFHRCCSCRDLKRGRGECVRSHLRLAGKLAYRDQMIMPLEPEQSAREGVHSPAFSCYLLPRPA